MFPFLDYLINYWQSWESNLFAVLASPPIWFILNSHEAANIRSWCAATEGLENIKVILDRILWLKLIGITLLNKTTLLFLGPFLVVKATSCY
jgi:hypothetical protein